MRLLFSLFFIIFLHGCSESSDLRPGFPLPNGTESPASVVGRDLSGNYRLTSVECYSNVGNAFTNRGTLTGISDTITIQGNDFTEVLSTLECTETTTGRVVFNENGTFDLSNTSITATDGGCTISGDASFLPAEGVGILVVQPFTFIVNTNSDAGTRSGFFITNPRQGNLGLTTLPQIPIPAGDHCFAVYTKE